MFLKLRFIQIKKEEAKLSSFANDMILYVENPESHTHTKLEIKKWIQQVLGYKINMQK